MDTSGKVLHRFLKAEAIADPKSTLANFGELIRRAEELVPAGTAEKALRLLEESEAYPILKDYPKWEELAQFKSMSYRVEAWLKLLPKNAYIHGSYLFLAILQMYSLPPALRKKVEMTARVYAKPPRPRIPKKFDVFPAFEKLKQTLQEHYNIAAQAIAQGKAHGDEGAGSTKLKVGPFTLVNTGGFSDEVMQNIAEVTEKAVGLIQRSGLGKVLYGDIHVSGTLSKSSVLAFYLRNKDELFIRANAKTSLDTISTVCHELGHRFETMFLKGKASAISALYYKISGQERVRRQELTSEYKPEIGDTATEKGKTYKVIGFGYSRGKVVVKLERVNGPKPEHATTTYEGWANMVGGSSARTDVDTNPNYQGFVTTYAKTDPSENFAEMFAFYCMDRLPALQSQLFEELVFDKDKTATRVAERFAADWTTMKFEIRKQHPDMDGKVADLFDAASTLTRDTHAKFQNAKAGIGGPTADDWEDIAEAYEKAVRMWNRVLDSKREHLGGRASDLLTRAENTRKVAIDREREAKKQFREALDQERIDSNRP